MGIYIANLVHRAPYLAYMWTTNRICAPLFSCSKYTLLRKTILEKYSINSNRLGASFLLGNFNITSRYQYDNMWSYIKRKLCQLSYNIFHHNLHCVFLYFLIYLWTYNHHCFQFCEYNNNYYYMFFWVHVHCFKIDFIIIYIVYFYIF